MKKILSFISLTLICFIGVTFGRDFYVSPTGSGRDCSQATPCSFQSALNFASANGEEDIINVGSGTYYVTNKLESYIRDNQNITIEGNNASDTILDGSYNGANQSLLTIYPYDESFNVLINIANLTFQNNTGFDALGLGNGNGSFLLQNCIFDNNTYNSTAAGVYAYSNNGQITFVNDIFTNNYADDNAAFSIVSHNIHKIDLINNIFMDNHAVLDDGNGLYGAGNIYINNGNLRVINNTFAYNTSDNILGGLGIKSFGNTTIDVTDNIFWQNDANKTYGAVDLYMYITHNDNESTDINLYNNDFDTGTTFGNSTELPHNTYMMIIVNDSNYTYSQAGNVAINHKITGEFVHGGKIPYLLIAPMVKFEKNYNTLITPVLSSDIYKVKPIAVGNLNSGKLNLQIELPQFVDNVDVFGVSPFFSYYMA